MATFRRCDFNFVVGCHRRQLIILPCQAVFDRDVLPRDIAGFVQAALELRDASSAAEVAEHRHRLLLRAGAERPCNRGTGKRRQERTAVHVARGE